MKYQVRHPGQASFIPRTSKELCLDILHQSRSDPTTLLPLPDNHATCTFLRHVMELVFRTIAFEEVRCIYAELLQKCRVGQGVPTTEREAMMILGNILNQPFPTIIVSETMTEDAFGICDYTDPSNIHIDLRASSLHRVVFVDVDSYEYSRWLFVWTIVILHEFAHYINATNQVERLNSAKIPCIQFTPVSVNSGGEPRPARSAFKLPTGEAGVWLESRLLYNGVGRICAGYEPIESDIGHLYWGNRVDGTVEKLTMRWVCDFVDMTVKDVRRIFPPFNQRFLSPQPVSTFIGRAAYTYTMPKPPKPVIIPVSKEVEMTDTDVDEVRRLLESACIRYPSRACPSRTHRHADPKDEDKMDVD